MSLQWELFIYSQYILYGDDSHSSTRNYNHKSWNEYLHLILLKASGSYKVYAQKSQEPLQNGKEFQYS